jgi:hypothetical protein
MAGEIQLNGTSFASESSGTITVNNGTLGSGVVFPAGSIVGWEQVTTVPTAIQGSDTTYTDVTGSSKNYTPSSGSNYVVYEYTTTIAGDGTNAYPLPLFKFLYDGSEVANTNHGFYLVGASENQGIGYYTMRFILSSWSGSKNVKLQYRAFGTGESFMMHKSTYSGNASTTDVFTNIYQVIYSVM